MKFKIRYRWPSLEFLWDDSLVMYIGKGFWGFCEPLCHLFGRKHLAFIYFGHCNMWGFTHRHITFPSPRLPKPTGDKMQDSYNAIMYAMYVDPKGTMEAIEKSPIVMIDECEDSDAR